MHSPRVHTVILNWNGYDDTAACLDSLRCLDYPDNSVIVVDNGSNDDSALRLRDAYSWITLLETGCNLGFSGGNNLGIRLAIKSGADYVWLLNNDTVVFPNTLSELVRVAGKEDSSCVIGSVIHEMSSPKLIQAWGGGVVNIWSGRTRNIKSPGRLDFLTAASILVPRAVFELVGLLDERYFLYWEDVEFSFRVRASGARLVVADSAHLLHTGSSSLRGNKLQLDAYAVASMTLFLRDYSPVPTLSIVAGISLRIMKRLLTLDFRGLAAVISGVRQPR